jgi:hypothetical protein
VFDVAIETLAISAVLLFVTTTESFSYAYTGIATRLSASDAPASIAVDL